MVCCCYQEIMFSQESCKLDFSFSCKNICRTALYTSKRIYLRFLHVFPFPFFGEWLSCNVSYDHIHHYDYIIWCIFCSKNKTFLTWSSWLRLYSSLNFLEKTKLCYISFYTRKTPWIFLLLLVSLASQPSLFIIW